MTEYETASLALQEAALAAQQAAVWVAAIVGAAQCSLIAYGLYIMRRAAIQRDAQHRENMAQHQETMKALDSRHQEAMATLKGQQEAQSDQHRETMAAIESRHRENMEAIKVQSESLRELIRRTSAPPAP